MIGQTLKGHYRIYDRLGDGSAGTAYLARDSESGQMVVVKVLHAHLINESFVGRFEREIDLLQRIDNPHIIQVYDWGVEEEQPDTGQVLSYIVTEFVEGLTLAHVIERQGKLSEEEALLIARQLAMGLADIHERGIIHRDIKPQNIMISPEGEAKIIDFGLAKGADHATLTGSGMFSGTLNYASPEQVVEAGKVDHRADIYSLGVVLYEMLTGRLPVTGKFASVMLRILQGDLDPITDVSPEVESLINEMLAREIKERISSAEHVIRRIGQINGETPPVDETAMVTQLVAIQVDGGGHGLTTYLQVSNGLVIPVTGDEIIIGRSAPKDPNIPDVDLWALGVPEARTTSRRHLRVYGQDQQYFVEDLGSMNGTWVNGQPLTPNEPFQLTDGDVIAAGRVEMVFRDD